MRAAGLVLLALAAVGLAPPVQVQEPGHVGQATEADLLRGAQLYVENCAVCHGPGGNTIVAVDLSRGRFRTAVTDDDLRRVIRTGIPDLGMPPSRLDDADIGHVITYLRLGFGKGASLPAVRIGDAARGREVFAGKGACLSCHRVGNEGSRAAPDLTTVGSTRTPAALYLSLVDPSSAMLPINRPIRLVTAEGEIIGGRRLNEDTYAVLLIDDRERLLSFDKPRLREYEVLTTSTMPAYAGRLTAEELSDLLGYLLSLKEPIQGRAGGKEQ